MCKGINCKSRCYFNKEGEKKALYCNVHKLEGMINIKNPICIYPDCKSISYYNNKEEIKTLYCKVHKLEGMMNVKKSKMYLPRL